MFKRFGIIWLIITVSLIFGGVIIPTLAVSAQSTDSSSSCLIIDLGLNDFKLSPEIPHDAYNFDSQACNENDPKPPQTEADRIKLQRVYDIFSWESFLAINWPVDDKGSPLEKISDAGAPQWTIWKESYEVFKEDGSKPADWEAPRTLPATAEFSTLPPVPDKRIRVLFAVNQAGSELPLWDQNGNMVYYEILLNQVEFEKIRDLQFYNQEGQIDYFRTIGQPSGLPPWEQFEFPWGSADKDETGSIELKLAWKIMDQDDIPGRFFTTEAYVLDNGNWVTKTVGLVGMHISHKTASSRNWIWSTFEQVDNLQVNDLEALEYAAEDQVLKPSFYDPTCPTCPVNVLPAPDPLGIRKTQVLRAIPISKATEELNDQVQERLKTEGSVWQYYELIGTQYVTDPSADPAATDQGLPESITNKSGGKPAPVYLLNSVIETYFQQGNQEVGSGGYGSFNSPKVTVFETQSCMGCHFSAGLTVARAGDNVLRLPGSANFSFLLQKAKALQLLFSVPFTAPIEARLNEGELPPTLTAPPNPPGGTAKDNCATLSSHESVTVEKVQYIGANTTVEGKWLVTVRGQACEQAYIVRLEENELKVYVLKK